MGRASRRRVRPSQGRGMCASGRPPGRIRELGCLTPSPGTGVRVLVHPGCSLAGGPFPHRAPRKVG